MSGRQSGIEKAFAVMTSVRSAAQSTPRAGDERLDLVVQVFDGRQAADGISLLQQGLADRIRKTVPLENHRGAEIFEHNLIAGFQVNNLRRHARFDIWHLLSPTLMQRKGKLSGSCPARLDSP
jgi:hypothetical protein